MVPALGQRPTARDPEPTVDILEVALAHPNRDVTGSVGDWVGTQTDLWRRTTPRRR